MNEAFLCLGGNIGNRLVNINVCKKNIERFCGTIIKESKLYETEPWGSNSVNKYLNQVIKITTTLDAIKLLSSLLEIEKLIGRKRNTAKNSDRKIDIDILFFNSDVIFETNIEIPHPRLHERNFVLFPLNEIEGNFKHPVFKKSISTLLKNSKDKLHVTIYSELKPIKYISFEGNIGSGKSTLANALAKSLNAKFLPEEFDENALLPIFYKHKKLFAFPLEYSFLINRFNQLKQSFNTEKKIIVSDYSIYKCLWFAKLNLSQKDFLLYKKQFNILINQLPKPDLIIYIKTTKENLLQNIKKRGRLYEQNFSENYLKKLDSQYNKGLKKLKTIKKFDLTITNYKPKVTMSSIKEINNFIKDNFCS